MKKLRVEISKASKNRRDYPGSMLKLGVSGDDDVKTLRLPTARRRPMGGERVLFLVAVGGCKTAPQWHHCSRELRKISGDIRGTWWAKRSEIAGVSPLRSRR